MASTADPIIVHAYLKNPIAVHSEPPTFDTVPDKFFGGQFIIHPSGSVYADQKAQVEAYGFTIVEERPESGQTVLLVHGAFTALKALLQDPNIATIRVQMAFVLWPLAAGQPLNEATISAGSTRTGTQAFH